MCDMCGEGVQVPCYLCDNESDIWLDSINKPICEDCFDKEIMHQMGIATN